MAQSPGVNLGAVEVCCSVTAIGFGPLLTQKLYSNEISGSPAPHEHLASAERNRPRSPSRHGACGTESRALPPG